MAQNVNKSPLIRPKYLVGKFYQMCFGMTMNGSTAVPAADKIYFHPFPIFSPVQIKTLHMRIAAGGAGSAAKVGVWRNSPVSGRPLDAPLAADNVGQATTASNANTTHDVTDFWLSPGLYWFGSKFQATLPTMLSIPQNSCWAGFWESGFSSSVLIQSGFSFDDAYANNMPTLAEGATFTAVTTAGIPVGAFGT